MNIYQHGKMYFIVRNTDDKIAYLEEFLIWKSNWLFWKGEFLLIYKETIVNVKYLFLIKTNLSCTTNWLLWKWL